MNERLRQFAEQAGFEFNDNQVARCDVSDLERFAALVREDEREACAKWLEELREHQTNQSLLDVTDCVEAIRMRGRP